MGVYADYFQEERSIKNRLIRSIKKRFIFLAPFFSLKKRRIKREIKKTKNIDQIWKLQIKFLDHLQKLNPKTKDCQAERPPKKIIHFIGSLQAGGAERQLCNCAIEQKKSGLEVSVMLLHEPKKNHGHYLELLRSLKVEVRVAGEKYEKAFETNLKNYRFFLPILNQIPNEFKPMCLDVFGELLAARPDVFHCWLDHPNIWGGFGAALAQVPRVILSTRNVNPTHFPYLNSPYFKEAYRRLLQEKTVRLINNSENGARDYAKWLGIPKEKIYIIKNGLNFKTLKRPSLSALKNWRKKHAIPQSANLIAGVFRLSEEKQPMMFLEVAKELLKKNANLYFVIAGVGPYSKKMKLFIKKHQILTRVRLVGRVKNIGKVFANSIFSLLCSKHEGFPNVILESMWFGCPVIATRAGGTPEAVVHDKTGLLVNVNNKKGLIKACHLLLKDKIKRETLSRKGVDHVAEHFCAKSMAEKTTSIYL